MSPRLKQSTCSPPQSTSGQTVDSPLVHHPYKGVDSGLIVHSGDCPPAEFVLRLRAAPGHWRTSPEQRLRAALKTLLRGYGLRCLSCATKTEPRE